MSGVQSVSAGSAARPALIAARRLVPSTDRANLAPLFSQEDIDLPEEAMVADVFARAHPSPDNVDVIWMRIHGTASERREKQLGLDKTGGLTQGTN